jgi:hypothetical protein
MQYSALVSAKVSAFVALTAITSCRYWTSAQVLLSSVFRCSQGTVLAIWDAHVTCVRPHCPLVPVASYFLPWLVVWCHEQSQTDLDQVLVLPSSLLSHCFWRLDLPVCKVKLVCILNYMRASPCSCPHGMQWSSAGGLSSFLPALCYRFPRCVS